MTYALVDNATLTAVQRIQGDVATRSTDSVDTDLIALESFVQGVLFYDRLVAVDDYIEKHRDDRLAAFPYITFLDSTDFNLDEIEEKAAEKARNIEPEIRGGEFVNDDFRSLLVLLQTHIVCTWDISSSIYYLTLKVLAERPSDEFEKYGKLAAAIFSELADTEYSGDRVRPNLRLVDRHGNPIHDGYKVPGARWGDGTIGGVTGAIKAFVASLVWLSNRSIFYSLAGSYLHADTILYPIRQTYQQHYLATSCGYGTDFVQRIVNQFSQALSRDLTDIQAGSLATATALDLPIFSAWLARETGDPAEIVKAALELRDREEFVKARSQMREVRRLYDEREVGDANREATKVGREIEKASQKMRVRYGIETPQGLSVTRLVHVYNTVAAVKGLPSLPAYDFRVKLPPFLDGISAPSGFGAAYRNVGQDLATVWGLGSIRDELGKNVVTDTKSASYQPKNEEPRFQNVHARFKSPM